MTPKQTGSGTESGYNGWSNYETWNVALWITNDEGLYKLAKVFNNFEKLYLSFVQSLKGYYGLVGEASKFTPDGVQWNDECLDIKELDKMIKEL